MSLHVSAVIRRLPALAILLTVISACGDENESTWSSRVIALGEVQRADGDRPVLTALSVHPAGRKLATAGDDHRVLVWNVADGSLSQQLSGHRDWVRAVAYSPDGRILATAGHDGRVVLWDAEDGQQLRVLTQQGRPISAIRYSPDATSLATLGFADRLHLYDAVSGAQKFQLDCPCRDMRSVAFSPDGSMIAAGGRNGKIRVWDARKGIVLLDRVVHRQRIRDLAFSPDGRHLASCGDDRMINLLKLETGQSRKMPVRPCKVFALAFIDSDRLATAGSDNVIRIWEVAQGTDAVRLSGHTGTVTALISHDAMLISASFDTSVRIWTEGDNVAGDAMRSVRRVGSSAFKLD